MQSWLEDLALLIEAECFGLDPPSARFRHHFADKLTVEDHMSRLRDVVLPMVDRANRAFIRDLMAIKRLRSVPTPVVAVEQATQVNVSDRQVNVTAQRADAGKGRARARLGRGAKGKPS